MPTATNFLLAAPAVATLAPFAAASYSQSIMHPGAWDMRVKITAIDNKSGDTKTLSESTIKKFLTKEFLGSDPYMTPGVGKEKMVKKSASCATSDEKKV